MRGSGCTVLIWGVGPGLLVGHLHECMLVYGLMVLSSALSLIIKSSMRVGKLGISMGAGLAVASTYEKGKVTLVDTTPST